MLNHLADTSDGPVQTPETVRLYAADWLAFIGWCRVARRTSLPAADDTLAAYLLATAAGSSRGTIGRKRAAIRAMHRQHGLPPPALNASTRAALRSEAASVARPARSRPVVREPSLLRQLAMRCSRDLAGMRDRALLLLVASRLVTSEEALGLECEQVRFTQAGAELRLRRTTAALVVPRSTNAACPVRALEDWFGASETRFGPVFRKVDRWGNVEHARLGPDGVRRIVARHQRGKP